MAKINEILRKSVHITGVVLIPLAAAIGARYAALLCFLVALALLAYPEAVKHVRRSFFGLLLARLKEAIDFFRRDSESRYEGAVLFLFSSGLVLALFPVKVAFVSIVVLSLGDGFSTLFGMVAGRHKVFFNPKKSWEGTVAFLVFSLFGCSFLTNPATALAASLVGAAVELLPVRVNDNFAIPIVVALFLTLGGVAV